MNPLRLLVGLFAFVAWLLVEMLDQATWAFATWLTRGRAQEPPADEKGAA